MAPSTAPGVRNRPSPYPLPRWGRGIRIEESLSPLGRGQGEGRSLVGGAQSGVSREVAAPDVDREQRRETRAHGVTHARRVIDDGPRRLTAPGSIATPPLAVMSQGAIDLDRRMLVQRVESSRSQEEHAHREPRVEHKPRRPVGGPGDDRVPVALEERGIGRLTPVVGILRPRQGRTEGSKSRAERLRGTARSRLQGAVPESTDGETLDRDASVWPVARRVDRPREPSESVEGGGGTRILRARAGGDQRVGEGVQESTQQSPAPRWIRMRYALPHA